MRLTADVTRDGQFWMIRIPQLDGVDGNAHGLTQALSEDTVVREAVDYAAVLLDVDPRSVEISVRHKPGVGPGN